MLFLLISLYSCYLNRTFATEHFGALALPIGEFLALEHGTEYSGYGIYRDEHTKTEQESNQLMSNKGNLLG